MLPSNDNNYNDVVNASVIFLNNIAKNTNSSSSSSSGAAVESTASFWLTCVLATGVWAYLWWDNAFCRGPRFLRPIDRL